SGYKLDFDVRYLWMRQKEILGSHFANAYECMRANQLMAEGKIRPVLWQAMGFEGVPEAHQLLHENKHLGKIAIMVGATDEGEGKGEASRVAASRARQGKGQRAGSRPARPGGRLDAGTLRAAQLRHPRCDASDRQGPVLRLLLRRLRARVSGTGGALGSQRRN